MDLMFDDDLVKGTDFLLVDGINEVNQSIMIRLQTPKGSNAFHPEDGNGIYDLLSENIDDVWLTKANACIKECLEQDARINVVNIQPYMNTNRVSFDIKYRFAGNDYGLKWGENIG